MLHTMAHEKHGSTEHKIEEIEVEIGNPGGDGKSSDGKGLKESPRTTTFDEASLLKITPRTFVIPDARLVWTGIIAACGEWGWSADLVNRPQDFIDTVIYDYFRERGIYLSGYFVEEEIQKTKA